MRISQKNRSRFNDSNEFAGKQLPLHPINRYKDFPLGWKKTRKKDGHIPKPKNNNDDLFSCCLTCQGIDRPPESSPLWKKSANAQWLRAEWKWDFGHTLPEDFIKYGVGVTPPKMPIERDRIFVYKSDLSRGYLDITLQKHAVLTDNQHEAKLKLYLQPAYQSVAFPGQLIGSSQGDLSVAIPLTTAWGDGKEVWQRYSFRDVQLAYNLPILVHGQDIIIESGKVKLNGLNLN